MTSNYHPAARVADIAPEADEMVPVRRSEIRRLADEVTGVVRNPIDAAGAWSYTWLGIGISAALSLLGYFAVPENDVTPEVVAATAALAGVGLFLAAFCGWLDRRLRNDRIVGADKLAVEIRELDTRAPRPSGPEI